MSSVLVACPGMQRCISNSTWRDGHHPQQREQSCVWVETSPVTQDQLVLWKKWVSVCVLRALLSIIRDRLVEERPYSSSSDWNLFTLFVLIFKNIQKTLQSTKRHPSAHFEMSLFSKTDFKNDFLKWRKFTLMWKLLLRCTLICIQGETECFLHTKLHV